MRQYSVFVRPTLTIGEEADSRLRRIAREQNRSFKDVVDDALGLGLAKMEVREAASPYRVESFDTDVARFPRLRTVNLLAGSSTQ